MPPDPLALIRRAKAEAKASSANGSSISAAHELPPLQLLAVPAPRPALAAQPCASAHYFPDFVSPMDEELLLKHILEASASRWSPWNDETGRRTQNWGGRPGERTVHEPLPGFLQQLTDLLVQCGAWPVDGDDSTGAIDGCPGGPPNHVIINEYRPGAGLTPHTDGPLYAARVATLSLWSDVVMELHTPGETSVLCEEGTRLCRLLLRRRSLNVLSGDAYRLFHGIRCEANDEIDGETVANYVEADAQVGERVVREKRISIVFVRKL